MVDMNPIELHEAVKSIQGFKEGIEERLSKSHPDAEVEWLDRPVDERTIIGKVITDGVFGIVIIEYGAYDKIQLPNGKYAKANLADLLNPELHVRRFQEAIETAKRV